MDSNPSRKSFGKPPTKITRVTRNIELTTSPVRTTITLEHLGESIDQMDHDLPTIC